MTMTAPTATEKPAAPPKVTTVGPCPHCGHRCKVWSTATLTDAGHVDGAALMAAHGVKAAEVVHDDEGKIVKNADGSYPGATPIAPMEHRATATFKKHGGRVGPPPPPWQGRRRH